jgi:hypothetical protein
MPCFDYAQQPLKTSDLFLTAYLLTHHIQPEQITAEGATKKKIIFVFNRSDDALKHFSEFQHGTATTNVLDFKRDFALVRDWMFDTLRGQG